MTEPACETGFVNMPLQRNPTYAVLLAAVRLVAVPCAIIWILGHVVGVDWARASVAAPISLVGGVLVNQLALGTFAARMQLTLRVCEIRIGWLAAIRVHLQSMFYFFVLPMTVGLEIARFIKIRTIQPAASTAGLTGALLLDRLLGASSALILAMLCIPLIGMPLPFQISSALMTLGAFGAILVCGALAIWPRSRRVLGQAWDVTRGRRTRLAGLLVLSMFMHVLFAAGVKLMGNGLGLPIAFLDTLFAVAGGMLLVAIPVSLAGLGPAEAGAAALFTILGYDPSVAIAAGALPYLARFIGALEGGIWEIIEGGASALVATRRMIAERPSIQS